MICFSHSGQAADKIIIGVATSLTSMEGRESYNAVAMALDQVNSNGGIQVGEVRMAVKLESIDLRDSQKEIDVPTTLRKLEHFIKEKQVHAILVGPFRSEILLPAMDIFAKYKVPMLGSIAMSPASDSKIMKDPKYKYVFRVGLNSKYLVDYLINSMRFLKKKFGFNKVYIMNQDVAWTRTSISLMIKIYLKKAGWEIKGLDIYPSGTENFLEGLKKAQIQKTDVILALFDMPQSSNLVKQWNQMKSSTMLFGFISPMVGPGAWKRFQGNIAGSMNIIFELGNIPSVKHSPALMFYQAYRKRYGLDIQSGHGPAPSYDSVFILAEAIKRAGSLDPDKIVSALEKTDRIGVMGRTRFNQGHQIIFGNDPHKDALACIIQWTKDGKRNLVYPPSIADIGIYLPNLQ